MDKSHGLVIIMNRAITDTQPSPLLVTDCVRQLENTLVGAGYEVLVDEQAKRPGWRLNELEANYPHRLAIFEVSERDTLKQQVYVRFNNGNKEQWPIVDVLTRLELLG